MTTRRHTRRGVTLTEVLVAMFVMAVGMLALLTLFPLGALQMGEAVRNDRCAQLATQADVYLRQSHRANYLEPIAFGRLPTDDTGAAMDDPNLMWQAAHQGPIQELVQQYVSANGYPNGRLLPGGVTLGFPSGLPGPQPIYPPLPPPLPGLTPTRFMPPPSDPTATPPYTQPTFPPASEFRYALVGQRPGPVFFPGNPFAVPVPSYAVLVDPLGYANRSGMAQVWVAGTPGPVGSPTTELLPAPGGPFPFPVRLPRRTVGLNPGSTPGNPGRIWVHNQQVAATPHLLQYFPGSAAWPGNPLTVDRRLYDPRQAFQVGALTDDHTFEPNGAPGSAVIRQGRYTWAAVLQRTRNEDPTTVSCTILVFDGKPPSLAVPGDEALVYPDPPLPTEPPLQIGARQIRLSLPARTPDQSVLLRRGGWIMDGTITLPTPGPGVDPASGLRNNKFYQVTGVTEVGPSPTITGGTQYVIDIDPPFQGPIPPLGAPAPPATQPVQMTQLYLFAGLAQVYERPALAPDVKYQQ